MFQSPPICHITVNFFLNVPILCQTAFLELEKIKIMFSVVFDYFPRSIWNFASTLIPKKNPEHVFVNLLRSPGIDSQPGGPVRQCCLTYRPARLHRLAESIPGLLKRSKIRALFFSWCFLTSSVQVLRLRGTDDGTTTQHLLVPLLEILCSRRHACKLNIYCINIILLRLQTGNALFTEETFHYSQNMLWRDWNRFCQPMSPETVFVNLLWSPGIDPSLAGRYSNSICRTGPTNYIAWRSRFLGIHSWAP